VTLTTDAAARKAMPIATGVLDYFPDALAAVAHCSKVGNDQHNPGEPLHWAKEKSTDEPDALIRHLIERGTVDTDGVRHSAKVAWRALALLQREIEAEQQKPKDDRPDWARPIAVTDAQATATATATVRRAMDALKAAADAADKKYDRPGLYPED